MKRLIHLAGFVVLFAACDSSLPTAPTPVSPPASPPPAVNTAEPGPVPIAGVAIFPGDTVDVTIEDDDPACFPNWDSSGLCRQFDVTMPVDGTLVATLMYLGPTRYDWNPEVFIAGSDGQWAAPDFGWPEKRVRWPAEQGATYRVVVLAYGPYPERVRLTVEVQ